MIIKVGVRSKLLTPGEAGGCPSGPPGVRTFALTLIGNHNTKALRQWLRTTFLFR